MDTLDIKKSVTRGRLYTIEFLRVFFVAGIVFWHTSRQVCAGLGNSFLQFFDTKFYKSWFGVEGFFIIAGFFLYRSIIASKSSAFEHIKKIWIRLIPALLFAFTILAVSGIVHWWKVIDLLFFIPGTGLAPEVIWNSEWFMCVDFLISCLVIGLFNYSRKSAWVIVGVLTYFALSLQLHAHPVKYSNVIDKVYYTLITNGICRGWVCMMLGMLAAFISQNLSFHRGKLLRVAATILEGLALYMLFDYMTYSRERFSFLEVELALTLFMVSVAHSLGYISSILNRISWIQFFSRYTYPFLIGHAVMIKCVKKYASLLDNDYKGVMVIGGGILLAVIEYHLIEKFLVPKIRAYLRRDQRAESNGEVNS